MFLNLAEKAQLISRAKRGDLGAQVYLDLLDYVTTGREVEIEGSVSIVGSPPLTAIAHIVLPSLPTGGLWYLSPDDALAKVVTCGSASSTTVELRYGDAVVAQWVIDHGDTDATYATALDTLNTGLAGGVTLTVNVTTAATGVVGPLSLKITVVPMFKRDDLFKVP